MKCNLDCTYCGTGIYGGHDNSTRHPPLEECLKTIDFMFEYADIYMRLKPQSIRYVILNVYGGEALHHPDIVEILSVLRERYQPYQNRWHLTITTTTNAVISPRRLDKIIPFIDEFTVSYHTDNTTDQKKQFRDNLLKIKAAGIRQKCIVLMHSKPDRFADAQQMIDWLKANNIKHLPRQIDVIEQVDESPGDFNYNKQQIVWFEGIYKKSLENSVIKNNLTSLTETGRTCCGGRNLCQNQQHKVPEKFVANRFPGWHCSVNHFFLYIKQVNGEVYVNKDCKMNYNGTVGPIGNLINVDAILAQAQDPGLPVIRCAKKQCYCGLCAPKAEDLDTYKTIMRKYEIPVNNLLQKTQRTN